MESTNNVGILAMEVYFPSTYVSQDDLEVQNNCKGKYTIGLGQVAMAFSGDREDINSISLTVVSSLLRKYSISPQDIGRLEIGTETLIDKSKSSKTVLMELFSSAGNNDIEGVTVVNACYGGTAALLNALLWVDSSSWDGRYAIVVAADIAVYSDGPARPTGGCGAVAMLVGRDAPFAINMRTRTCYSTHVWDFFKPKMESEYPEVNGALSQTCYLQALDDCYQRYIHKHEKSNNITTYGLQQIDEILFHSPYNKLVQKSFNRLMYLDMVSNKLPNRDIQEWLHLPSDKTYEDKGLENKLKEISGTMYLDKVATGCIISRNIGNTYTASVYMNLACLISHKGNDLYEKNLLLFSYGSGAMASLFQIIPRHTTTQQVFTIEKIQNILNIQQRLSQRQKMTPEDLSKTLEIREKSHNYVPYFPRCNIDQLYPGTYYLESINANYERIYKQKPLTSPRVEVPMIDKNGKTLTPEMIKLSLKNGNDQEEDFNIGAISIDGQDTFPHPSSLPSPTSGLILPSLSSRNGSNLTSSFNGSASRFGKLTRTETQVWASGKLMVKVVVTGIAAVLPGRDKIAISKNGPNNIQRMIEGENFITSIPSTVLDAMLEKNVIETIKNKDGTLEKRRISSYDNTINLCAAMGKLDLSEYGVSDSIASTMDMAVQVAIVAGLEALKDAGIITGEGSDGWILPEHYRDTTGVVFATSFPALDTAIAEVSRFYESKLVTSQTIQQIIHLLKNKISSRYSDKGLLSSVVDEAISSLVSLLSQDHILENDAESTTKPYEFDRKFLFRVLVLGNAQLAQIVKARGPNMQTNAACAGATQAIALAYDMIQTHRAERVIIIAGDNASSDTLMPWLGNGFRALGAANINSDIKLAARPFNAQRAGMILGSGGIGIILESEDGAKRRFAYQQTNSPRTCTLRNTPFRCRLLGTLISNSAYHGASMDKNHIASEMERFIASIEKEQNISRKEIATKGVYFSHETSTHASPTSSCAYNELYGLRKTFGDDFKHLLILNTKGFTGHAMGVSFEDVVAAEVLVSGQVPPVANFTESDPALGGDMKVSTGGRYPCKYALRFAAGFGSQVALALYGAADV